MFVFASQPPPPADPPLFIVDAHLDIAWNTLQFGRDLRESLAIRRPREVGSAAQQNNGTSLVSLESLLAGGVGLICATLYTGPAWANFMPDDRGYETPEEAYAMAREQLQVYTDLFSAEPRLRLIRTREDLAALRAARAGGEAALGVLILMEGGDPILTPAQFDEWFGLGVRLVGPAWSETRYSGGTIYSGRGAGPLTDLGRELLKVMGQRGAILDLSHMDEPAYLEAVDTYQGALIASHSNPRGFVGSSSNRHLSDDMIRKLAARGGVLGLVAYNAFLHPTREQASVRANTPLSRYLDAFAYVADLLGTTDHLGIGTDWDGGFGLERIPEGLDSHADLPRLAEALSARGYSDAQVRGILGENFLRLFQQALPAARESRFYNDPHDPASPYLYLTTTGRKSGQPRQIEIWYVTHEGAFYLCAEGGEAAHWVQNLLAQPRAAWIVQGQHYQGAGRALREGEPLAAVQALFNAKYGWSEGLMVELRPDDGAA